MGQGRGGGRGPPEGWLVLFKSVTLLNFDTSLFVFLVEKTEEKERRKRRKELGKRLERSSKRSKTIQSRI